MRLAALRSLGASNAAAWVACRPQWCYHVGRNGNWLPKMAASTCSRQNGHCDVRRQLEGSRAASCIPSHGTLLSLYRTLLRAPQAASRLPNRGLLPQLKKELCANLPRLASASVTFDGFVSCAPILKPRLASEGAKESTRLPPPLARSRSQEAAWKEPVTPTCPGIGEGPGDRR